MNNTQEPLNQSPKIQIQDVSNNSCDAQDQLNYG